MPDASGDERFVIPVDADLAVDATPTPSSREQRARPDVLAAIAVGGVLGALARYGLARLIPVSAHEFPWATFWTNVSGSLALGFILVLLLERYPPARHARAFIGTGFIGAYTTFSTFAVETDLLVKDGNAVTAIAYVAASLVVGLLAAWTGITVARRIAPR